MSEVITYTDGFKADCQITKMATFASKGGGLTVQVQLPLQGDLAAVVAMHLNNIASIEMKFSAAKVGTREDEDDETQGELALGELDEALEGDE